MVGKTKLDIYHNKFLINDKLTYSEIPECKYKGLLMNTRFIQGIFDDKTGLKRYQRFGRTFEVDKNTEDLIKSLPEWYDYGVRAITVGLQGGGPCYTIDSNTIDNNPYGIDGKNIDEQYLNRLEKILDAADKIGMIVIINLFYGMQSKRFEDDDAIELVTKKIAKWIFKTGYRNIIIEVANEHDTSAYESHKVLHQENGILRLIDLVHEFAPDIPTGCSGTGGYFSQRIASLSDVIFLHGNEVTRNQFYNVIRKAQAIKPMKPILVNEDSQALSQMKVTFNNFVSWGYYNNMTKQEPPTDWSILDGEDKFFALRLQEYLTGVKTKLPVDEQFSLVGLEKNNEYENKRFIRLASLHSELIDYVNFYRNNKLYYQSYDDPFTVHFIFNWAQEPVLNVKHGEEWKAEIHLRDGQIIEKFAIAE